MVRLDLPEPDDSHPLDWYPEPAAVGLPGVLTETSYTLPDNLNLGHWLAIGETLQRMERSVKWWLGDWWNYGERRYGDMASQATRDAILDATGYTYNTVRQAGWVASRFELDTRVSNVPWSHHREVADLPPSAANELLTEVLTEGLSVKDVAERAKERKTAIAVEAALSQPAPDPAVLPANVRIRVADARELPLPDGSVHLIVTSPPYAVGKDYQQGDIDPEQWLPFCYAWCTEAFRVSAPNGRLALNVPLDTSKGGFRPTYSQAIQMAMAAGWTYRSTIVWFDDQLGKSTARGSMDSAAAPHIYAGAELVALFSKGAWKRMSDVPSDLTRQDWLEWTNGVWKFPGETSAFEGHPAPFPYELPRRLIKLLSFPGDVVMDPFVGSGTAALAASNLGRDFEGFDVSEAYVASTQRRVLRKGRAA